MGTVIEDIERNVNHHGKVISACGKDDSHLKNGNVIPDVALTMVGKMR